MCAIPDICSTDALYCSAICAAGQVTGLHRSFQRWMISPCDDSLLCSIRVCNCCCVAQHGYSKRCAAHLPDCATLCCRLPTAMGGHSQILDMVCPLLPVQHKVYEFIHQHKPGDDKDVHKQPGRLPKVSWICQPWQACQDWFVPISGILVILNMHGQG
jgi:hypothetical protein